MDGFAHVFKFNPNHDERGRFTSGDGVAGGGGAVIFASANRHEGNQNIDTAAGRVNSKEQWALKGASKQIDRIIGINGNVHDALGAWADGAENSTVSQFTNTNYQKLLTAAAMRGLLGEQKAVIAFKPDSKGPSRLFTWETKSTDLKQLNADMVKAGLEYHTLIPTSGGTRVMVWFSGGKGGEVPGGTYHRITTLSSYHGGSLTMISGHGQMLGSWDNRDQGRRAYEKVINNWARSNPDAYAKWKTLLGGWKFGANKSLKDRL